MEHKKYTTLFLDADGTILNFEKANRFAFPRMMRDLGLKDTEENYGLFCRISKRCWAEFEQGLTEGKSLSEKIFGEFFSTLHRRDMDNHAADQKCLFYLSQAGFLFPGALDFVKEASRSVSVIVVTNGHDAVQRSRLQHAGLMPYLSGVYTSEQVGCTKPQAEFFDCIFSDRPDLRRDDVILLGDSISSDINGAKNAGIAACLLDLGAACPQDGCDVPVVTSYEDFFRQYLFPLPQQQ